MRNLQGNPCALSYSIIRKTFYTMTLFHLHSIELLMVPYSTHSLSSRESTFRTLKWLHFAAFLFMFIQTIAYGVIGADIDVQPTTGFPGVCGGPLCRPELQVYESNNPIWTITLFVALAAFDHLVCFLVAVIWPGTAQWWLFVAKSNPLRWAEYSISASFMALAISILSGVRDVHINSLIFIMTGAGMLTGLIIEMLPRGEIEGWPGPFKLSTIRNSVFILGSICIFAPWLIIMCYFFKAALREDSDMPNFVWAAFLLTLILFIFFGVNTFLHAHLNYYEFHRAEMYFIVLSFTAKTFLAADVFGGLRAGEEDD